MNKDLCGVCKKADEYDEGGELWVECSSLNCNQWFHNKCVELPEVAVPETEEWYCKNCEEAKSGSQKNDDVSIKSAEADDHLQLILMAQLIKEKEQLCELKQQQLSLIARVNEKQKSSKVKGWLNQEHLGGMYPSSSKHQGEIKKSAISVPTIFDKPNKFNETVGNSKTRIVQKSAESEVTGCEDISSLLKKQMQLMNQQYLTELPEFSGEPDVWPIFYQQYLTTTEQGGFDDAFNLIRLRKSLKGEARQVVAGILSLPNCLPQVIGILEKRFGRQNNIVKNKIRTLSNFQPLNENKPHTVRQFFEFLVGFNATLRSVNAFDYLESPHTMDTIMEKLPINLKRQWLRHMRETNHRASIEEFLLWFEAFYDCANECEMENQKKEHPTKQHHPRVNVNKEQFVESSSKTNIEKHCKFCRRAHLLDECDKFKTLSHGKRLLFVRQKKLCFACLRSNHRYENCEKKRVCNINSCDEYHHKLLHRRSEKASNAGDIVVGESTPEVVLSTKSSINQSTKTLFRSLPVVLHNTANGRKVKVWAFLDEGSSPTMLLENIAHDLGLEGEKDELCTVWTDDSVRKEANSRRVQLSISGVGQTREFAIKNVRTVSEMILPIPITRYSIIEKYNHLRDLKMPDIPIDRPAILIGLEHVKLGLMYEIREGQWHEPVATRTRLGWTIHGKQEGNPVNLVCHICECGGSDEVGNLIRQFSTTESFGVRVIDRLVEAKDTTRANEILESTTQKLIDGYETGLLWRREDVQLPDSRVMASKRLVCFEKRLERDTNLKQKIRSKVHEHINKGYLVEVSPEVTENKRHWYLPMFAVTNANKPSKPRLVFDAAAKSQGVSLNDMLLKGPEMIQSLFGILLRFRLRQFAVSADIEEMFHRVRITEEDQLCQLILWRDCMENAPMKTYKMTRMTFGATCSPCSAHFVKDKNAKLFSDVYPRAVDSIISNHYVDNLLDCYESEEEAVRVARQVCLIHKEAGFHIRDWVSNSKLLMKEMNVQSDRNESLVNLNVLNESPAIERILGMYWAIEEDAFVFKVNFSRIDPQIIQKTRPPSKREVLKVIMSQFDPLGVLSPLIIHAKILMQEIWVSNCEWDDEIPQHLIVNWENWLDALHHVSKLRVPRWYFSLSQQNITRRTLHIFSDASESAFASVAFLVQNYSQEVQVAFVAAKSRVAPGPPKSLSIPRLELQAAVLATRLKNSITNEISVEFDEIVHWSDSKTVLGWIRSTRRKYSAFVSHRITEILESSTADQWNWLSSRQNVADEATRLSDMPEVSHRWLSGPQFLYENVKCWPQENEKIETTEEERLTKIEVFHVQYHVEFIDVRRFSKWERLLRCVGYVRRFVYLLKNCSKVQRRVNRSGVSVRRMINLVPPLTGEEMNEAEKVLFKIVQFDSYSSEIKVLKRGEQVSRKSPIFNLNPELDGDGILRLAGRLEATPAIIERNIRKPIILQREHHITNLLIDAVHRKFHHVNKECVVNDIRQFLWVPKIRVQLNKVVRHCYHCKYRLAKPIVPKMSILPEARLSPFQAPFSYTGVDFFGPVEITVGRRHEKRWGVLFVCLTMRAIHLELSSTLNTSSAIMCIRNFMCRRGTPFEIFSDNVSNLKAAEKELKSAVEDIDFDRVQNATITSLPNETRVKWTFIPPSAPHFGGSWERMIRIVKKSLYVILKNKYPREETLRNALMEIENLVNSRPLHYTPNDVENKKAITPNHLLRGSNRQMVPLNGDFDCRKQWRVAQALAKEFWHRWLFEYLPTISRRPKWQKDNESVQIGNLVLIIDTNLQRGEWKRGIISNVYPSKDGIIRAAEVKTSSGTYVRPVAKLVVIDVGSNARY